MTEDEKKLMDLVEEYSRADCMMGEYAGSDEEQAEYRADRDAAGEAILAHYRKVKAIIDGPPPVVPVYLDEEGGKWVEDPEGTHGWWSDVPGGADHQGDRLLPWPRAYDGTAHGTDFGDGTVLRYYRRVG